jgi:hypothetical protein
MPQKPRNFAFSFEERGLTRVGVSACSSRFANLLPFVISFNWRSGGPSTITEAMTCSPRSAQSGI